RERGRVPGLVLAAARGPARPRRADRLHRHSGHHLEAGVRGHTAGRAVRGLAAAPAGVLRAAGDPAAAAAATPSEPSWTARRRSGASTDAAAGGPACGE